MKKLLFIGLFICFGSAQATIIDITDFSGSETVIDFNIISNTEQITNQYNSSGVNFSGAVLGLTNPGDTGFFDGSTIASNWIYNGQGNTGDSWTATFNSIQNLVGFYAETNTGDDVTIEAFLGATSLGMVNFPNPNGLSIDFLGISDITGFDSIVVTTAMNSNGFFAMDDFRFESTRGVPEPSTIALFGLGLIGIRFFAKKKTS